jgi:hypothetical protein
MNSCGGYGRIAKRGGCFRTFAVNAVMDGGVCAPPALRPRRVLRCPPRGGISAIGPRYPGSAFVPIHPGFRCENPGFYPVYPGFHFVNRGFHLIHPGFRFRNPGFSLIRLGFRFVNSGCSFTNPGFRCENSGFFSTPGITSPYQQLKKVTTE